TGVARPRVAVTAHYEERGTSVMPTSPRCAESERTSREILSVIVPACATPRGYLPRLHSECLRFRARAERRKQLAIALAEREPEPDPRYEIYRQHYDDHDNPIRREAKPGLWEP